MLKVSPIDTYTAMIDAALPAPPVAQPASPFAGHEFKIGERVTRKHINGTALTISALVLNGNNEECYLVREYGTTVIYTRERLERYVPPLDPISWVAQEGASS